VPIILLFCISTITYSRTFGWVLTKETVYNCSARVFISVMHWLVVCSVNGLYNIRTRYKVTSCVGVTHSAACK